jgi:RNA polymerase-binding transcription factor DksA
LTNEKHQIEREIASLSSQDPHHDYSRADDNAATDTEAAEISDHDRISAEVDELTNRIEEIDTALARIDDGTYGTCVNCGERIDTARLMAMPTAQMCLSCQEASA